MYLSDYATLEEELDNLFIRSDILKSILEGECPQDCIFVSHNIEEASETSFYIYKIILYKDSCWLITGIYERESESLFVYDLEREKIIRSSSDLIGIIRVLPTSNNTTIN